MDIIKFNNPNFETKMEQAEVINGFTSKMWIERYISAGEFTLVAPIESDIRDKLPIGSFISHVNSTEVMIVENHEINDDAEGGTIITVTGRSFESFLENRVIDSNQTFPVSTTLVDYTLAADYTWNQAVKMLNDHILAASLIDPNNAIPYTTVLSSVTGTGVAPVIRTVAINDVYSALLTLLAIDNLGVKSVRPGPWSPLGAASPNLALLVHQGVDQTANVIFSYTAGEVNSADYLWSNKMFKNAALITGTYVQTVVLPASTGYDRRMIFVDGTDIDSSYTTPPIGASLTAVVSAMQQRGIEALASLNNIALTKAQLSNTAAETRYRVDFDIGDLITVSGDYNETTAMRVSEYVEVEDATGESGSPTLTID